MKFETVGTLRGVSLPGETKTRGMHDAILSLVVTGCVMESGATPKMPELGPQVRIIVEEIPDTEHEPVNDGRCG